MTDVEYPPNCPPIKNTNNNSELIKKLKILSESLQNADSNEECGQPNRYRTLAAHLSNATFLNNSSKEVQIWLACCLADIFRVYDPNIPIGDPVQLKEVLIFLIRALKGLGSPSSPLFRRHYYLLENLSHVNTLWKCLDLPSEDACVVIRQLIKTSLEIVNEKGWASRELERGDDKSDDSGMDSDELGERKDKMINIFVTMISKLLNEVAQIENTVLDAIFFFMINPQKSNYRESCLMARMIVESTYVSLEAPISTLLTKSLLVGGLPPECELVGTSRAKLYDVIIELHEAVPKLVAPVVHQIGTFLGAEDSAHRMHATKAVGVMIRNPKSRLYDDHPEVWKLYLSRFKDTCREIRLDCTNRAVAILLTHSQIRGPICAALCRLLLDNDDEIRLAAVKTVFETARRRLDAVNEDLILACCARMRDKKPAIRHMAISKLLLLHSKVVSGDEYTVSDKQVVAVIPNKALALYLNASMKEERVLLERFIQAFIVPYRMETSKRIPWMCELFCKLEPQANEAFMEIALRNAAYRRLVLEMLDIISRTEREAEKGKDIENRIQRIANAQPEPSAFSTVLRSFTNLLATDQKAFELTRQLVRMDDTTEKLEECGKDLLLMLTNSKLFNADAERIMRHFVERFSPLTLDRVAAADLVRSVMRAQGDASCGKANGEVRLKKMLSLTKIWAEAYPHLFSTKDVVSFLINLLETDDSNTVEISLRILLMVCSQTSLKVAETEWLDPLVTQVWSLVSSEQPGFGRVAKLAVRLMRRLLPREVLVGKEGRFAEQAKLLVDRLCITHAACENALRALSEMFSASPEDMMELFSSIATEIVVPQLMLSAECAMEDEMRLDSTVPVLERQPVPKYTLVKVHAMKWLSRSLTGHVDQDLLAQKTFRLLVACLQSGGDLHGNKARISDIEKAYLRATAGSCVLRLCQTQKYAKMFAVEHLVTLSTLIADDSEHVRYYFAKRLFKNLYKTALVVEFLSMYAMVGLLRPNTEEEEAKVKTFRDQCKEFITLVIKRRLQIVQAGHITAAALPYLQPEYTLAYAVFLLSQSPIVMSNEDGEGLSILLECVWFLMEPFVAQKSFFDFELIYRSFTVIRQSSLTILEQQVADGTATKKELKEANKKMWALADLSMMLVIYRAKIVVRNEPAKTLLSKKIFTPLTRNNDEIYAPAELIEDEKRRNGRAPVEKKRGRPGQNGTTTTATGTSTVGGRTRGGTRGRGGRNNATRGGRPKKAVIVEEDEESSEEERDGEDIMQSSDEEKEKDTKVEPTTSSRRRRGLPPVEEVTSSDSSKEKTNGVTVDGEVEEKSPIGKRGAAGRRGSQKDKGNGVAAEPSTSGEKEAAPSSAAKNSPKKRGLPLQVSSPAAGGRRGRSAAEKASTSQAAASLEDLDFSPIVKGTAIRKNTSRHRAGLAASTPIRPDSPKKAAAKRKAAAIVENEEPSGDESDSVPTPQPAAKRSTRSSGKTDPIASLSPEGSPVGKKKNKAKEAAKSSAKTESRSGSQRTRGAKEVAPKKTRGRQPKAGRR